MRARDLCRSAGRAAILMAAAGLWRASTVLLRRRVPDRPDPPSAHGLPCEPVEFTAQDGTLLRGWWIAPPSADRGTIVIVHGHNGSMDGDTATAARLARAGWRVLMFDLRAHGRSGGHAVTFGAREYLDVLAALDWLQAAQGVTGVGLLGFSMGAGVALIAAALDGRVRAVVADGTIGRIADAIAGLGRTKGIPPALMALPARAILLVASLRAGVWIPRADPLRWAERVPCPVLFIHGAEDPFNTVAGARRLAALAPDGQLWLVPGAGHRDACRRDPGAYDARVLTFFAACLAGESL